MPDAGQKRWPATWPAMASYMYMYMYNNQPGMTTSSSAFEKIDPSGLKRGAEQDSV